MKITYMSDLHLEFLDYPKFDDVEPGDVLILAGDIFTANMFAPHRTDAEARSFKKYFNIFQKTLTNKFDKVYYVMGNHEHYNSIFKNTANSLRAALRDSNILLLDDEFVDYKDFRIIGTTLWSDFQNGSPISLLDCGQFMNDFRLIGSLDTDALNYFNRYTSRRITPEFILDVHNRSKSYIDMIAKQDTDKKVIVISHHAPSYRSLNPQHSGNAIDGAYASQLENFIHSRPNIKYWFHGHTHMNVDYMIDGCRVLANQRGYKREYCHTNFKVLTIEV